MRRRGLNTEYVNYCNIYEKVFSTPEKAFLRKNSPVSNGLSAEMLTFSTLGKLHPS